MAKPPIDSKKSGPPSRTVGEQLSKTTLPKVAPVPAPIPLKQAERTPAPRSVKEAERQSAEGPKKSIPVTKPTPSKATTPVKKTVSAPKPTPRPVTAQPVTPASNIGEGIYNTLPIAVPQAPSGGSTAPTYVAAPEPQPIPVPPPPAREATTFAVKSPEVSLIQYNPETLPQELITDLIYEDVGGIEMINIARSDTINGQAVNYSLVSNLSVINQVFNPNNILAGQIVYSSQLGQYALDIANKLADNIAYLDSDGNLIIEFTSIGADELAEIEISANGTIYTIGA